MAPSLTPKGGGWEEGKGLLRINLGSVIRWRKHATNKWMLLHSAWLSNESCSGLLHSCSTRSS